MAGFPDDCPRACGSTEIVRFLADKGCSHIFGLPGSSTVSLIEALEGSDITIVPTVHESVTVAAADGYARVKGAGFAYLYMLPGVANGLANLYNAWRDQSSVIVFASQQSSVWRSEEGTIGEGDLVGPARPFTRLARELSAGMPVRHNLEAAWRAATGCPPGPALLALPEDVLVDEAPVRPMRVSRREPAGAPDLSDLAARLRIAERPLLVLGGQVRRHGGSEAAAHLAARHGIALAWEPGFLDRLPVDPGNPSVIGSLTVVAGAAAERQADVVAVVGARLVAEGHPRPGEWFAQADFVAHINGDAAKLEETRTADWSCACDSGAFLKALDQALGDPPPAELLERRRQFIQQCRSAPMPDIPFLKTLAAYGEAAAALDDALERGWVVDESVMASIAVLGAFRTGDGGRYIGSTGASLGWGTGAAVGVALASEEPVTCVLGDGALRFGVAGLWTAVERRLPVTYVIFDNGGYGSTRYFAREHAARRSAGGRNVAPAYSGMDFRDVGSSVEGIIRGFGVRVGEPVTPTGARAAIEAAWNSAKDGPNAVVVRLPFGD
jgi:thiamine pyrophosphate-dependent acetolactate synthase large subunit-like protein